MAKFQSGVSGNPTGRMVVPKDKRTEVRGLLEPHQGNLVNTAFYEAPASAVLRQPLPGDICPDHLSVEQDAAETEMGKEYLTLDKERQLFHGYP